MRGGNEGGNGGILVGCVKGVMTGVMENRGAKGLRGSRPRTGWGNPLGGAAALTLKVVAQRRRVGQTLQHRVHVARVAQIDQSGEADPQRLPRRVRVHHSCGNINNNNNNNQSTTKFSFFFPQIPPKPSKKKTHQLLSCAAFGFVIVQLSTLQVKKDKRLRGFSTDLSLLRRRLRRRGRRRARRPAGSTSPCAPRRDSFSAPPRPPSLERAAPRKRKPKKNKKIKQPHRFLFIHSFHFAPVATTYRRLRPSPTRRRRPCRVSVRG